MGVMTSSEPLRRSDALTTGWSDVRIRQALLNGEFERLDRGLYLPSGVASRLDELGRHKVRIRSAARGLTDGAAFSHVSAAVMHGFALWRPDLGRLHITRDGSGGGGRSGGRHVHVGSLPPNEIVDITGIACTSAARTVVDLACTLTVEEAVIAGDSALAADPAVAESIVRLLATTGRRQGIVVARQIVGFLDGRSESAGESLSRLRMKQFSMPSPTLQKTVLDPDGAFVARVDFFWDEFGIVGEFDGMIKYDEGGSDAVRREKRREDTLRDLGYEVVRWTWAELFGFERVRARFERAVARSRR